MNNIFITNTSTDVQPRADATIRIRYYKQVAAGSSADILKENDFREVQLLEFHPDNGTCLKCRSTAHVRPERWMTHEAYKRAGDGYLKSSEQYVPVREFMILEEDRQALLAYCAKHLDHGSLIIHPCPRPFPTFLKGERVSVVGPDVWGKEDKIGALATVAEDSSEGTLTQVTFDQQEYNKETDEQISSSIGMPSLSLRRVSHSKGV
jgi:hypothetical protein